MLTSIVSILLLFSNPSPPPSTLPPSCRGPLTRAKVVACARSTSPHLAVARQRVEVAKLRRETARVLLPENPTLGVSVSHRSNTTGDRAVNAQGTLSQALEVGGQRGRRMRVADAERRRAVNDVDVVSRDVAGEALLVYFDVLAAQAEAALVQRSLGTARRLEEVASARASAGLGHALDVELASALRSETEEDAALAIGRTAVATSRLSALLGLDPAAPLVVAGALAPLPASPAMARDSVQRARESAPTVAVARAEVEHERAQLALLRRAWLPNPSLSLFVQRDGFDETVIGGGLSFPLPLPAPLGRTNRGKIAEARARIVEAEATTQAVRQEVTVEAAVAFHEFDARRTAARVYTEASATRTERALAELDEEIAAGRLPVKEALVAQQALQRTLLRGVHARHALAAASVRLAVATGAPLDGGAQ